MNFVGWSDNGPYRIFTLQYRIQLLLLVTMQVLRRHFSRKPAVLVSWGRHDEIPQTGHLKE